MSFDRELFFNKVRHDPFDGTLSGAQVIGTEAILDSAIRNGVTDPHHVANVLAQVFHETGGYMLGIKETVYASHSDKSPSDMTVISRLDRAYAKGQLPWVREPYWRDGAFGRGPIMLTHWHNYEKMGERLGVPLRTSPNLALDPEVGADIAVVGMSEGMFTGKKLSDYHFPSAIYDVPSRNPRRIVNGQDGTDQKVADYHCAFYDALLAGGWSEGGVEHVVSNEVDPRPDRGGGPQREPASRRKVTAATGIAAIIAFTTALLGVSWDWLKGLFQ